MVRNFVKKPKVQYDNKDTQHGLQLINNVHTTWSTSYQ